MNYVDGEKNYKVPEYILKTLIMSRAELEALEAGGIDNWCWYSESKMDYLKDYQESNGLNINEDFYFDDIVAIEIAKFEEV